MGRITIELINEELKESGWKCISTEYKNLDGELQFNCKEGHLVCAPWKKIRTKRDCPVCKGNKYSSSDKILETKPKKKGIKRVLALDQATKISGWSIFDGEELIRYGTFETNQSDEIERISTIKNWFLSMLNNWKPDFVAIEGIQFQEESSGNKMGVTVFQGLARLQGVLMETCYSQKVDYTVCPTNTWRNHCGVKGRYRADKKRSMQLIAKKWYDISLTDDEADAIGIGRYAADLNKIEVTNWE